MTNELILQGAVPAVLTPWSSALLHGSLLHLGVNLLILVYAGMQVERVIGKSGLIIAYLLGALAAAAAQFAVDPSGTVPMVGASGAISALFGLYALLYGQPKQVTSHRRINRSIHVLWLLVTWVVLQWMAGVLAGGQGVMLATPAHIGGFVAGLLMQRPLLLWRYRKA
jgi:membrane associated rhomboid family serine protease